MDSSTGNTMRKDKMYEVIIVGGSYSGLAAGMALGRALRSVLIIDSGRPCNRQTPHSHNFITQDGKTPNEISAHARQQVLNYDTVEFFDGLAIWAVKTDSGFEIGTESGEKFSSRKLIFATGIRDAMPPIEGFSECWGISAIHCPFCHGYEFKNEPTGILGTGEDAFEFASLISNWTKDLTLFTNGPSMLTEEQSRKIHGHTIKIVETEIQSLAHDQGYLQKVIFKNGTSTSIKAVYARLPFEQHCTIPESLGCELTDNGIIKTDQTQKTNIRGVFACGDNTTRIRTLANAVAMGTTAGMMVNREITFETF